MNRARINFNFFTMNVTLEELSEWLSQENLQIPKKQKQEKTFMDIAGISRLENHWSDIYAYFFNPKEKHGLGRLFIKTLNTLIAEKTGKAELSMEKFSVIREYSVEDDKRIDLLIKNEKEAIIIENKVYAKLTNDLDIYWKSVLQLDEFKRGVILSLYEINPNNPYYINITHKEFAKAIENALPNYSHSLAPRDLLILQDLIQNIYNKTSHDMDTNELNFYYSDDRQRKIINELSKIRSNIIQHICKSIEDENTVNIRLAKRGIDLQVKAKGNHRYTYYTYIGCPKECSEQIMLTLKYNSLWDFSQQCRVEMYLELQGNIMKYVEQNLNSLKEAGIEPNYHTPKKDYWHFQKEDILFTKEDLLSHNSIIEKIVLAIENSLLYKNGLEIIRCYKGKTC